jgi:hypothetical protein
VSCSGIEKWNGATQAQPRYLDHDVTACLTSKNNPSVAFMKIQYLNAHAEHYCAGNCEGLQKKVHSWARQWDSLIKTVFFITMQFQPILDKIRQAPIFYGHFIVVYGEDFVIN